MTTAVEFNQVSRHFDDVRAVDGVDLAIEEGEFFALLGPSGSGKTTCLRLIAGFDSPTQGEIKIFDEPVQHVPPYRRNVNTVFQDYALFPHLSVGENVAYSLKIRKIDKTTRKKKAEEALDMVQLAGLADRRPAQLSGGQRQRVALARALVGQPKVLLLDEPLGALDLKLREEMQEELKTLQRLLGITFVFVTHDQTEALSMADRVAIFNEGRLQQVDTPENIYHRPNDEFVARFVGSSNVLSSQDLARLGIQADSASLRPEAIQLVTNGGYAAQVCSKVFLGSAIRMQLALFPDGKYPPAGTSNTDTTNNAPLHLSALVDHDRAQLNVGDRVRVHWQAHSLHLMGAGQAGTASNTHYV